MLLVIFGAGASYDSVPHLLPPSPPSAAQNNFRPVDRREREPHEDSRPPLANQLFDDRKLFVAVMNQYVACKPLINLLRGDVQVERQLAKFEEDAKTFPPRRSHLAAIRYYLHHMLWNCQENWETYHRGITNHLTFLDAIDRWCYKHQEEVCYVTFNYDTMIERSMSELWGLAFENLDAYISNSHCKLIKLHGSIDWALELKNFPPRATPAEVINDAAELGVSVSEHYRKVVRAPAVFDDGHFGFPALAIPVENKSEFVCPTEHLAALASVLPKVTKIITVGWRATELHFLTMLKKPLTGLQRDVDLMVVSGSNDGAKATANSLAIRESGEKKREFRGYGFSGLIKQIDHLESFLA